MDVQASAFRNIQKRLLQDLTEGYDDDQIRCQSAHIFQKVFRIDGWDAFARDPVCIRPLPERAGRQHAFPTGFPVRLSCRSKQLDRFVFDDCIQDGRGERARAHKIDLDFLIGIRNITRALKKVIPITLA